MTKGIGVWSEWEQEDIPKPNKMIPEQILELKICEAIDALKTQLCMVIYSSDRFKNLIGPGLKFTIEIIAKNETLKGLHTKYDQVYKTGIEVEF